MTIARTLVLASLAAIALAATAQPAVQRAPADPAPVIERFADDPDHAYGHSLRERPTWWDLFWRWVRDNVLAPIVSDKARFFWRYVAPVLGVLGLAWALYRLIGGEGGGLFARRDRRAGSGEAGPLLDVDDIAEVDLGALLARATAEGRMRDVVRYRFLLALQGLARSGAIEWRKAKTNMHYAAEVRAGAPGAASAFDEAARVFAWVWYGDHPLDAPAARAAEAALDRLDAAIAPAAVSS